MRLKEERKLDLCTLAFYITLLLLSLYVKTSDLGTVLLTETEKEGVHTHAVHTEESVGN